MTKWFAWFREEMLATFILLTAIDLNAAVMIAEDLARRNKVTLIGVIIASEQFNPPAEQKD